MGDPFLLRSGAVSRRRETVEERDQRELAFARRREVGRGDGEVHDAVDYGRN